MKYLSTDAIKRSAHETSIPLFDLEAGTIPGEMSFKNIEAQLTADAGLQIKTSSAKHFATSVNLEHEDGWNWSELPNFCFAFDAVNLNERSTQIFINFFDQKGQQSTRCINITNTATQTYMCEMKGEYLEGGNSYTSGLRSNPAPWDSPFEYATWMWGTMNMDLTKIVKIELCIHGTLIDHELVLSNFRLIMSPECNPEFLTNEIDKFGQRADAEYAQKIHSDEELAEVTQAELEELKSGAMENRSRFGGYTNGPRLEATGYFRTEKIGGKWFMVDPEGYPYFATGLDIIRLANTSTMTGIDFDHTKIPQRSADDLTPEDSIEKVEIPKEALPTAHVASKVRRNMFQWLPEYDEPLAEHYGYMRELFEGATPQGETFSFYAANLQRKYGADGADYMSKWREVAMDRMINWGFTCFGNWTAPEFYSNEKMPFFANGWIIGDFKTVSSGNDFWSPLPDPFDPKFRERAEATVAQVKEEIKDTPWCVGIFIDNEKSWGRMGTITGQYGIAINTLSRDAEECPTKAVFVSIMKDKYSSIQSLNDSWKTDITSWEEFTTGVSDLEHNEQQLKDYGILLEAYASEYFRIVKESLKAVLPNHLYMGARFADWGMTPEVVRASAKHVDVVSYNYYKEGLHPEKWDHLAELDMPSIIGEFCFGSSDTGFYHPGLLFAKDQQERGEMYADYMHSVIDNPWFVGAHYFQYIDSPITGRSYDGENYNIGFVSVTDTPYKPVVDEAKRVNSSLYERRLAVEV